MVKSQDAPVQADVRARLAVVVARQLEHQQPRAPLREQQSERACRRPTSSTLSASSCRAIRQRDAPSATRTLSSWRRAFARASSRLAMLAQAISSTSATTAMMTKSGCRYCRPSAVGPLAAGRSAERILQVVGKILRPVVGDRKRRLAHLRLHAAQRRRRAHRSTVARFQARDRPASTSWSADPSRSRSVPRISGSAAERDGDVVGGALVDAGEALAASRR